MEKKRFEELVTEIREGKSNCIIVKEEEIHKYSLPGVKTLMILLKEDPSLLKDAIVFDKIVGKGAVALLTLGGVSEIYAELISDHAINLLDTTDIKFSYGGKVPFIENKTRDGLCPIELISITSDDPKIIYKKIMDFLSLMKVPANNTDI